MTNKELQALLKTFPPDAIVFKYEDGIYDYYADNKLSLNYRDLGKDSRYWEGDDQLDYTYEEIDHSKVKTIIL